MHVAAEASANIRERLDRIYGDDSGRAFDLLMSRIEQVSSSDAVNGDRWSERDVVLITYGDQVQSKTIGESPLQSHLRFLTQWRLPELINTVHFLPFFPYSSDDGFSVIDYRSIDPALGDWSDVREIGQECRLMFDFVVNHVSQESSWFQDFLAGVAPYDQFFIEADPSLDLTGVTRPRSLPLLHEYESTEGPKWVWTTFSRDQVDLNYASPELLAEVIAILLEYVAHGARIIRLDAIAYLWKTIGTSCIHLPETHEVVKLLRAVLDAVAPDVLLVSETNVPHDENVSYFGDGDEAHMVYQFSLPPLLLDSFINNDAIPLKKWLAGLSSPPTGATYFNFTASHDGIGVRPLEGHVDDERLAAIVARVRGNGGHVSTRRCANGTDAPYELNVSYIDALKDSSGDHNRQTQRFLATQAIMLSLQGLPAIYFHSLVGTPNDQQGVAESNIPRRINRRKYDIDELNSLLNDEDSVQQRVFEGVKSLLRMRIQQPAFHPDADQTYVESSLPNVLAFERTSHEAGQRILVLANFGDETVHFGPPSDFSKAVDLLSEESASEGGKWSLEPAQVRWLAI